LLSKGIYDILQPAGYDVLLMNTNNSQEMEKKALNDLYQQRVDGIIVQPNSRSFDQYQSVLRNQIPLVLVDREVDDQPLTVGKVTSANFDASYRLGRKLGSRRYQNVITVSSRFAEASGQHPRIKGFQLAAAETGLTYRNIEIKGHDDDWLARELTRVMGQLSGRTVVISLMGPTLFTLLKIFKHEKVTFPKDLGLISFDDWSWSQYVGEDGIFLLRQDMELMGNLAAQKLLNQIESHSMISDTSILPVTIDEHASI
ncbi:substrate-binding domain-containing protein, partial [Limosilactobacillus mucosae]|nr:substrate-binding domain-containing protein [Limosilactobacillus mucosae]